MMDELTEPQLDRLLEADVRDLLDKGVPPQELRASVNRVIREWRAEADSGMKVLP